MADAEGLRGNEALSENTFMVLVLGHARKTPVYLSFAQESMHVGF